MFPGLFSAAVAVTVTSLVLSLSVYLRDRLPPPFRPTSRNVMWMGPCAVIRVGSLSPSGYPW